MINASITPLGFFGSRTAAMVVLAVVVSGCGATQPPSNTASLADLRAHARAAESDPTLRKHLALAELVAPGGDPTVAARALSELRAREPHDVRVRLALGLLETQHGDFPHAVEDFSAAIESARASRDALAGPIAEIAVSRLVAIRGDVADFDRIVEPVFTNAARDPGVLGAAATVQVLETGVRWARERGLRDQEHRWIAALGCVTDWTVAGAFGPGPMLRFDEQLAPEAPGPLAHDYDVGPGRGRRPTWAIRTRGCAANLGRGRSEAGVFIAATDFELDRDQDLVIHVQSPNTFAELLDGAVIATLDSRRRATGTSLDVAVHVVAGRHTLRIKLASRFSSPLLVATITDRSGRSAARYLPATGAANAAVPVVLSGPEWQSLRELPIPHDPFEQLVVADLALARHDPIAARELLRPLATAAHPSAMALNAWGSVALEDPHAPTNISHDTARRAFERARDLDPGAYYPHLVLARLASADNRAEEALQMVRVANERFADNPEVESELADRLMDRGWDGEAREVLQRANARLTGSCWPTRMLLSIAQRHADGAAEHALAEQIAHCDALADSLALTAVRERRWDSAQGEFQRLLSDDPEGRGLRRALVDVTRQRGRVAAAAHDAAAILEENPEDASLRQDLVDMQLALGERDMALQALDREIARAPGQMWELYRYRAALREREELAAWRLDGNAVLGAFERSGHSYDAAAVLVLDYTVRRQRADGSALELTHNIVRLQSQEGVDEHATFNPPEGAMILTLRTHKADGRVLEPDNIARLEAIAFPDVHIGDAIEFEYVRVLPQNDVAPGGFVGDRFYFRGFDIPYDHSELVLVVPQALAAGLRIEPRGPAPEMRRRELSGALVEYRWLAERSQRMTPEPRAVAAREFIPSIGLGSGASWERYVEVLRDRLADQDPYDPEADRLAREIVGGATQPSAKLARLHRWVIEHIEQENGGSPFALAPAMLAGRSGHRARVLCYMLGLQQIPCHMALVHQANGDATESNLPEDDIYPSVLLLVTTEHGEQWVTASDRGAPAWWIPAQLAGQPAIVLDSAARRAHVTPLDLTQHAREVSVRVTLARDGSGRADVVERLRGFWAVSWRESLRQIDRANLEHEFESYVGHQVTAASLAGLHIEGDEDPNADIVLRYSFTAPSIATPTGSALAFEGIYAAALGAAYAQVPVRTTPMYNPEVLNSTLDLEVLVPERWTVGELPHDAQGTLPSATWSVSYARTPTGFHERRVIRIPPGRIAPAAYGAFAAQIRAIDAADTQRVMIRPSPGT